MACSSSETFYSYSLYFLSKMDTNNCYEAKYRNVMETIHVSLTKVCKSNKEITKLILLNRNRLVRKNYIQNSQINIPVDSRHKYSLQ